MLLLPYIKSDLTVGKVQGRGSLRVQEGLRKGPQILPAFVAEFGGDHRGGDLADRETHRILPLMLGRIRAHDDLLRTAQVIIGAAQEDRPYMGAKVSSDALY